jgi:hypothetical protein
MTAGRRDLVGSGPDLGEWPIRGGPRRGRQGHLEEDVPVSARISHLSFDALDAHAQSVFRAAVLGFAEDPDDPTSPVTRSA